MLWDTVKKILYSALPENEYSLWIKPIARYHITKRKLDHALTQYLAQANETMGLNEKRDKQKRWP